jgi:hypothetical protein
MTDIVLLNTTRLTNAELHNIKRTDNISFARALLFSMIPLFQRLTPDGTLELSYIYNGLNNITSIYQLESTISSFVCTENYFELFSLLYRVTVPMGLPIEIDGRRSYTIFKEFLAGFRTPYNLFSGKIITNRCKKCLFINGVGTDINVHKNNLSMLENIFNCPFDGVYSPTRSISVDLLSIVTQYLSATSETILFDCIISYIFSASHDCEVVIVAHSRGTITIGYIIYFIIYNMIIPGYLKGASYQERTLSDNCIQKLKLLRIYSLANCAISNDFLKIGDKYYPEFYSMCNLGDPVPHFGRLGDIYLQYYTDIEDIRKLSENDITFIDYDEISNIVDPNYTRANTTYIDKLTTIDKPGHLLRSYLFEKGNGEKDYFCEIFKERENAIT